MDERGHPSTHVLIHVLCAGTTQRRRREPLKREPTTAGIPEAVWHRAYRFGHPKFLPLKDALGY